MKNSATGLGVSVMPSLHAPISSSEVLREFLGWGNWTEWKATNICALLHVPISLSGVLSDVAEHSEV